MPVTGLIAGGLGAAGSIGSALIGANASESASKQQAAAMQAALNLQQQMFGTVQSTLSPFISSGSSALSALLGLGSTGAGALTNLAGVGSSLTGGPGSGSALDTLTKLLTPGTDMMPTLKNLPGFQFQSKWGDISTQNALAAQGLGGSAGPVGKALSDYNQGLASSYYGQFVNQLQGLVNTGTGALSTAAGLGSGALGSAAGVGGSAAGALAGAGTQSGANMGATLGGIGQAQASGTLGFANALSGGLQGATGSISNALLLSKVLGGQSGGGGLYNIGAMPATGAGAPSDFMSSLYAASQGIPLSEAFG